MKQKAEKKGMVTLAELFKEEKTETKAEPNLREIAASMQEEPKTRTLDWIVRFLNYDLNALTPVDRARILAESQYYLFALEFAGVAKFMHSRWGTKYADFLPPFPSADPEYWEILILAQKSIREVLERKKFTAMYFRSILLLFPFEKYKLVEIPFPEKEDFSVLLEASKVLLEMGKKPEIINRLKSIYAESFVRYVLIKLFFLLQDKYVTAIQKCKECANFFFNPFKREKNFCSPKCMWRFNARQKREALKKDPKKYQKYLEMQRERMSRKYSEKMEKKFGPKVKVGKRREGLTVSKMPGSLSQ